MGNKLWSVVGGFLLSIGFLACGPDSPQRSAGPTDIYHTSSGTGPALLLIHGGPGLGATYLEDHFAPLSENFQLITYDQRNSGRSPLQPDTSKVRLPAFLTDISELLDYYKVSKAIIIGHSWGGLLAMKFAINHPERVSHLILINSNTASSELNNQANTKLANRFSADDLEAMTQIRRTEAFLHQDPKAYEELMEIGFSYQFKNPNLIRNLKLGLPQDFGAKSQALGHLFKDLGTYNFMEELKSIEAPTLLLYGLHDPLTPYALNSMAPIIPNVETVVIEDAGHFPFIEKNTETLDALKTFISAHQ